MTENKTVETSALRSLFQQRGKKRPCKRRKVMEVGQERGVVREGLAKKTQRRGPVGPVEDTAEGWCPALDLEQETEPEGG